MVGPKKQAFCPRINMLKGNFDTNYFELGVIPATFMFLEFFRFFRSNLSIFEPKVEKMYMPLISIFAPKIMEELNNQL